jgi:hypothetical protein
MASRRAIRRWSAVALGSAVAVGVLLAVLVYEQDARARSDARGAEALQSLQEACDEQQKRDARTVSMTPDAAAAEAPPTGNLTPGLTPAAKPAGPAKPVDIAKAAEAGKPTAPAPAPKEELPPGVKPKRQLRMTDYGFIAHNLDLEHDPCTQYYRARASLR